VIGSVKKEQNDSLADRYVTFCTGMTAGEAAVQKDGWLYDTIAAAAAEPESAEAADAVELERLRVRIAANNARPLDEHIALHYKNVAELERRLRELEGKPPRGPPPPELVAARRENEELAQKWHTIGQLRTKTRYLLRLISDEEARKRGFPQPRRAGIPSRNKISRRSSYATKTDFAHPSMFSDDL